MTCKMVHVDQALVSAYLKHLMCWPVLFLICRVSVTEFLKLAAKVLPQNNLESIKVHSLVHHLCQDILNHGSPYNHDAQGAERAHKGPKGMYAQTNRQLGGYAYMTSMLRMHEVRLS